MILGFPARDILPILERYSASPARYEQSAKIIASEQTRNMACGLGRFITRTIIRSSKMSMSRRWITREEIAEIHESIAQKQHDLLIQALYEESDTDANNAMREEQIHRRNAYTIRQIDSLGSFAGQVYRR